MIYFNKPYILYALFALLIPILVHLFQLRKFQKIDFTNVKFLKELIQQNRKSSQLKKWLILLTRMLILTSIIIAFSEPYLNKKTIANQEKEIVFYIDNSISTQEKGPKGELLKTAIQELINQYPGDKKINIITNNQTFKNKTLQSIKNDLINLEYTNHQLDYKIVSLKAQQLFTNKNNLKSLIYISDFQKNSSLDSSYFNPKHQTILIQTLPVSKSNISIDSAYFVKNNTESTRLKLIVKKQYSTLKNLPIAVYNNDSLIRKSNIALSNTKNFISFDLPSRQQLNLKVALLEATSTYDNELFVTKNKFKKLNILAIGKKGINIFLSKIFTQNEFNFQENSPTKIAYSTFEKQHLIIINEVENLSNALIKNLLNYRNNGGTLLFIPNENSVIKNYNELINVFDAINENKTRLTKIHFSHPIYSNVFEKKIKNFQFPYFNKHYPLNNFESTILSFENKKPLLVLSSNIYVFASALNSNNSNFKQAPLIVPTLYNIAKSTLKNNTPYYVIGKQNSIDFELKLEKNEVLSLSNNDINFIPIQKIKAHKINIETKNNPTIAGIYNLKRQQNNTKLFVAYNYSNSESLREYHSINKLESKHIKTTNSLSNTLTKVNSNAQIGTIWKWFVIFALLFLIVELLILKYFK